MAFSDVRFALLVVLCLAGCKDDAKPAAAPSKKSEPAAVGVTVSEDAASRLGITAVAITSRRIPATRLVGGDVVSAGGRSLVVAAPVSGMVTRATKDFVRPGEAFKRGDPVLRLTPVATVDRDLRAQGGRAVSIAEARLAAAEAKVKRTETLLGEGAASEKNLEEAQAELAVARAERDAADAKYHMLERAPLQADVSVTLRAPDDGVVRTVSVGADGMVSAGTPLFELVRTGDLWVRAAVFVGEVRKLQPGAPALVRPLGTGPSHQGVEALPASGPPTADPLTATFDLYFALPAGSDFRAGERVAVTLTYRDGSLGLVAPVASVVHDPRGDAWVYEEVGQRRYERRLVEVDHVVNDQAVFTRGVRADMRVASVGVPELFALEFGSGK